MRMQWFKWVLVAVFACLSLNLTACDTRDKTKMPVVSPEAAAERQEAVSGDGDHVPIAPPPAAR